MLLKNILVVSITVLGLTIPCVESFEPVTTVLGIGAVASLIYSINKAACYFSECCEDRWIANNITSLRLQLDKRVYGQHLMRKAIVSHIHGHVRNRRPEKALVLSFHGPTGTGKNHVSRIIAEALYKQGLDSEYVHLVAVAKEFFHRPNIGMYKVQLKNMIERQVKKCPRSMFIFDEMDKMPDGLIDTLKPYVDYHERLGGVDYRHAIFIFLSNTGAEAITKHMLQRWRDGVRREDIGLTEMENVLARAAINSESEGGLWHSELITKHLISAFIPFLPLERGHVYQCIRDSMVQRGYYRSHRDVPRDKVQDVLAEMTFYPQTESLFSVTGCKRVGEKVDYVML